MQVVRCFEDDDIHHVSGSVDPVRDIEVINTELILADLAALQKRAMLDKKKCVRGSTRQAKAETGRHRKIAAASRCRQAGHHARADRGGKGGDARFLPPHFKADALCLQRRRIRSRRPRRRQRWWRPDGETCRGCERLREDSILGRRPLSSVRRSKVELVDLSEEEAPNICESLGVKESGVSSLIRAVYHLLGLRTYPDHRRKGNARLDYSRGRQGPGRGWRHSFRFRARLHRGGNDPLRRSRRARLARQRTRGREAAHRGQGIRRARRRRDRIPV